MFDPELYRSSEEVDRWRQRDPITTLVDWMIEHRLATAEDIEALRERARAETESAVAAADAGPLEPVEGLFDHVTAVRAESQLAGGSR